VLTKKSYTMNKQRQGARNMRNGWVPSPAAAAGGAAGSSSDSWRRPATAAAAAPLRCYGATSGMSRAERFGCYNQPTAAATATATARRQFSTYRCCCCNTDFKLDTTDDPDPRPSPLGDRCDACRAAEKPRPLDGKSLTEILGGGTCRFCSGSHWALDCPTRGAVAGNYVMEVPTVDGQMRTVVIPVGAAVTASAQQEQEQKQDQ
jgi:hypothetical protein